MIKPGICLAKGILNMVLQSYNYMEQIQYIVSAETSRIFKVNAEIYTDEPTPLDLIPPYFLFSLHTYCFIRLFM